MYYFHHSLVWQKARCRILDLLPKTKAEIQRVVEGPVSENVEYGEDQLNVMLNDNENKVDMESEEFDSVPKQIAETWRPRGMFFGGDGARDVFNLAGNRELDKVIYLVIRFAFVENKAS